MLVVAIYVQISTVLNIVTIPAPIVAKAVPDALKLTNAPIVMLRTVVLPVVVVQNA